MAMEENIHFHESSLLMICPQCKHPVRWKSLAHHVRVGVQEDLADRQHYHFLQCLNCRNCVMATFFSGSMWEPDKRGYQLYPSYIPDIPDYFEGDARESYREALLCYSIGAWNPCGTACRRALEQFLVSKGANGNNIPKRLKAFSETHPVPPTILALADHVRVFGRDGAHASDPRSPKVFLDLNKSDADAALDFCGVFVDYVFDLEAKIAEAQSKRPPRSGSRPGLG